MRSIPTGPRGTDGWSRPSSPSRWPSADLISPPLGSAAGVAGRVRLRFRSNGALDFEPAAKGLDGALDRLYLTIAFAQRDDTWRRLKVCGRKDCRQAFYDRSRNLSRVWCAPRCGNQLSKKDSRKRLGKSW